MVFPMIEIHQLTRTGRGVSDGKLEVLQFDPSDVYDIGDIVTAGA